MTGVVISIFWGLVGKLVTERFAAKLLVQGLKAWSKATENVYDDQVVAAMAEALGVDLNTLKEISK